MDDAQIKELETLLQSGRDNKKVPEYQRFLFLITGKKRHSGCSSCEANYLFNYLSSYINIIVKQQGKR
jgi:hypothetical protein